MKDLLFHTVIKYIFQSIFYTIVKWLVKAEIGIIRQKNMWEFFWELFYI